MRYNKQQNCEKKREMRVCCQSIEVRVEADRVPPQRLFYIRPQIRKYSNAYHLDPEIFDIT